VDRAAVAQSFQRVTAVASAHPSAHAVRIWLGNFHFVEGKTREAAAEYQQVIDDASEAELPHAYYNLGLAEMRMGELRTARTRFVNLIDRGAKTKWVDYAWWWVGRTHLDTGDPSAAKKAWNSALRGQTREVTSAAAIGVCVCELLNGDDEAAKKALTENRTEAREDHAALADCFDKLFRYRTGPSESRRTLLLDAMRDASDARKLGPGGVYLAGRIYRALDLPDRAAALYESMTTIRGPRAIHMTFDVAEWYELSEKTEPARQRYLAVAATDPKGLGPQAELRLAEMACRERDTEECIRRCRVLLKQKSVDQAEVLAVMGRAYELQRNYRLAADCFAGRVPVE
jgi:tetratricopeptide (TPR) repeat protein